MFLHGRANTAPPREEQHMGTITTTDGTEIFYRD
jgi:hypothetical protein